MADSYALIHSIGDEPTPRFTPKSPRCRKSNSSALPSLINHDVALERTTAPRAVAIGQQERVSRTMSRAFMSTERGSNEQEKCPAPDRLSAKVSDTYGNKAL